MQQAYHSSFTNYQPSAGTLSSPGLRPASSACLLIKNNYCGSGLKYKKCCGKNYLPQTVQQISYRLLNEVAIFSGEKRIIDILYNLAFSWKILILCIKFINQLMI